MIACLFAASARWVWANTSGQPVIVQGQPTGRHRALMHFMSANQQPLHEAAVEFTVPERLK
ncbi:MAG TPA: DUF6130 family protein [Bryobacteraceae bacterium]|nr:DUF6130 family protein [Bryobacteraceae bacterium]